MSPSLWLLWLATVTVAWTAVLYAMVISKAQVTRARERLGRCLARNYFLSDQVERYQRYTRQLEDKLFSEPSPPLAKKSEKLYLVKR